MKKGDLVWACSAFRDGHWVAIDPTIGIIYNSLVFENGSMHQVMIDSKKDECYYFETELELANEEG